MRINYVKRRGGKRGHLMVERSSGHQWVEFRGWEYGEKLVESVRNFTLNV